MTIGKQEAFGSGGIPCPDLVVQRIHDGGRPHPCMHPCNPCIHACIPPCMQPMLASMRVLFASTTALFFFLFFSAARYGSFRRWPEGAVRLCRPPREALLSLAPCGRGQQRARPFCLSSKEPGWPQKRSQHQGVMCIIRTPHGVHAPTCLCRTSPRRRFLLGRQLVRLPCKEAVYRFATFVRNDAQQILVSCSRVGRSVD